MVKPVIYKGKTITIDSFVECIPWNQLEEVMGKRNAKRFTRWLSGQTCVPEGVYRCDLEQWLRGQYFVTD